MAYEVARVHGLIMSNIHEEVEDPGETWPISKSTFQEPSRHSPDTLSWIGSDVILDRNRWSESCHSSSLESSTETETESDDEDDFTAGLAEQIAHSMLEDDESSDATDALDCTSLDNFTEASLLCGRDNMPPQVVSPQSSWSQTSLSASWSDSVSSSKQSSKVSSPPSTPFNSEGDAWDLLNAAAGEVVRLKMIEEIVTSQKQLKTADDAALNGAKQCGRAPQTSNAWRAVPNLVQQSKPSNLNVASRISGSIPGLKDRMVAGVAQSYVQRSWSRTKEEDRKVYNTAQRLPRNEGGGWNQRKSSSNYRGGMNQKVGRQNYQYGCPRAPGKPSDNSSVSQRIAGQVSNGGSGMRAVFLGTAGSGRESGGTGVFLPRCVGGGSEHRSKSACSTVLLPSRIVQVLNLNVEDMRTHPAPLPVPSSNVRNDCAGGLRNSAHMYVVDLTTGTMKYEGGSLPPFPRKIQGPQIGQGVPVEYSLPTEWTY